MAPIALLVFCGLGMLLSAETLRRMRNPQSRTDPVLGSPEARVFGFPNAWLSLVYFAAVMAFGAFRLARVPIPIWPVLAAAALSILMSLYLATRLAKLHRF